MKWGPRKPSRGQQNIALQHAWSWRASIWQIFHLRQIFLGTLGVHLSEQRNYLIRKCIIGQCRLISELCGSNYIFFVNSSFHWSQVTPSQSQSGSNEAISNLIGSKWYCHFYWKWDTYVELGQSLCHFSTEMAEIWSPGTSFKDVWTSH